jgi:hypothetical protein
MRFRRGLLLALLLSISVSGFGCAAKQSKPSSLGLSSEMDGESLAAPPIETVQAPLTQLERQDVVDAIDAGFGVFLQDFETEPSLTEAGEFRGFRIVRVHNRKRYEGLGIGVGDVITRINGKPIERPDEAFSAFVSLKTAPSLDVEYLRGDRPMRLSLPIVGEAKKAPVASPAPSAQTKEETGTAAPKAAPTSEKKNGSPEPGTSAK